FAECIQFRNARSQGRHYFRLEGAVNAVHFGFSSKGSRHTKSRVQIRLPLQSEFGGRLAERCDIVGNEPPVVSGPDRFVDAGQRDPDLDMPAANVLFQRRTDRILEGRKLSAQEEMEVEPAMIYAAQADGQFAEWSLPAYAGVTGHTADGVIQACCFIHLWERIGGRFQASAPASTCCSSCRRW